MSKEYNKTDLWNNKPQVSKFDKICAEHLVSAIQKIRRTNRRTKIGKWIPQFGKLRSLDGIEVERIKSVLAWYISHLKDKYVPKIYSADGFRSKFFQIEAAMEQIEEDDDEEGKLKIVTTKKGKITKHVIYYNDDREE